MKRFKTVLLWIACLCAAGLWSASNAAGTIIAELPGSNVWDVSGEYTEDSGGLTIDFTMTQDGKGKLSGFGSAEASESGIDLTMDFVVKGKITRRGSVVLVAYKLLGTGTATDGAQTLKFKAKADVKAEIDEDSGTMSGVIKVAVSARGIRASETSSYFEVLEGGADASVEMVLSLETDEKGRVGGDGTFTLSSDREMSFEVKGSDKKGLTKIRVKGLKSDPDAVGLTVTFVIDSNTLSILSLKGKIAGQNVNWVVD